MTSVEVAAQLNTALGESPIWDADRQLLHLVDILDQKIHQIEGGDGRVTTIAVDGVPGAIALTAEGGYIGGIGLDFATVGADGSVRPIARATEGARMNDGKCDARGRFIAGTMAEQERKGTAALYQLDTDGSVTELLGEVTLSNGLDWNPAGDRFYHIDTTLERVDLFDYDIDSGQLSGRRPFADLAEAPGRPDGLTVDAEGGVWVAVARAGLVHRYAPDGRLDAVIEFPTRMVTSCTFGGSDMSKLFVTSSRGLLPEPERTQDPVAGSVFVVEGLGVQGKQPHRYRGVV